MDNLWVTILEKKKKMLPLKNHYKELNNPLKIKVITVLTIITTIIMEVIIMIIIIMEEVITITIIMVVITIIIIMEVITITIIITEEMMVETSLIDLFILR